MAATIDKSPDGFGSVFIQNIYEGPVSTVKWDWRLTCRPTKRAVRSFYLDSPPLGIIPLSQFQSTRWILKTPQVGHRKEKSMRMRWTSRVVFLTLIVVIAGWIFAAGNIKVPGFIAAVQSGLWRPGAPAQLVYYDPLPAEAMEDET